MRVIAINRLRDFWEAGHPDSELPLRTWYKWAESAEWENHNQLKSDFPKADYVGNMRYVFNIKGNQYRLITLIDFERHGVLIRWIGTHAEYDKIDVTKI
jgi:mRNA interferase HigB